MKIDILKVLFIILASSAIGLAVNIFSGNGISFLKEVPFEKNSEADNEDVGVLKEPKIIKLDSAISLFEDGVIFIDAREHEDYLSGHIKNSVNIPYYDFENYQHQLNNIPTDDPVVTYCSGTDCDLSIMLGDKMFKLGYKKVFVFFGGWDDWKNAGYPVTVSD